MDQVTRVASDIPLVVDMDGTLIKPDTLHEALVQLVSQKPVQALYALLTLRFGRVAFKAAVADRVLPDVATVPINEDVLETIRLAKREGRKVFLATAADSRFAEEIAAMIGGFDGVFASGGGVNLKGKAKADRLVALFGARGFDYIGNDAADIPVWRVARTALVSQAPRRLMQRLRSQVPSALVVGKHKEAFGPSLRALRPHQWLKNGLIALPALAAHDFSIGGLIIVLIAFGSFSLGASSIYVINDMLDLPHDRAHPEKRFRPLAAGTLSLSHAVFLSSIVAALSIALALTLPWAFVLVLFAYFGFSVSYSVYLKRKLMIDVVALAMLYGIRVLAGGTATGLSLSHWLVAFCFFIFLSLALVKRIAEVMALEPTTVENIKGRGYRREDCQTIIALTGASGFVAVLVFALYINSPEVAALYKNPNLLWGVCILLVYWLGRVYFLAGRGEMHQDPVLFAATDRISLLAGAIVLAIVLAAL